MKSIRSYLFIAATACFIYSCGGNKTQNNSADSAQSASPDVTSTGAKVDTVTSHDTTKNAANPSPTMPSPNPPNPEPEVTPTKPAVGSTASNGSTPKTPPNPSPTTPSPNPPNPEPRNKGNH